MNVSITVRHTDVSDEVKARTEALVEKLTKYDSGLSQAEVIFDEEKHSKSVEGILRAPGEEPVVAKAEASDALSAVDQMVDKLAKILRRRRSQKLDRRTAPAPVPAVEPDDDDF